MEKHAFETFDSNQRKKQPLENKNVYVDVKQTCLSKQTEKHSAQYLVTVQFK